MRTLVTGATGFVGRYLVGELLERGHQVTALVRPSRSLPPGWAARGVVRLGVDLRHPSEALGKSIAGADAVFHLAATTAGSWRAMFDATVLSTENLIEAMRAAGWRGRLVHVSSFSVYDLNQLPKGALVDESTPLEPHPERRDDYAWTKLLQERMVRELAAAGEVEVTIVRPGVVYGRERQFQHQLGRELGRGLLLYGGLSRMRLNYVENTASLLAECGQPPVAAGQVFNAVDPEPLRQWQYARHWRRGQEGRAPVIPFPLSLIRLAGAILERLAQLTDGRVSPPRFVDPYRLTPAYRNFRYDTTRPTRVLGWVPPVARDEALRRTFGLGPAPPSADSDPRRR